MASELVWDAVDDLRRRLRVVEVAVAVIGVNLGVDLVGLLL